jgi:phosphohistidine phosphatase SixA
VLIYLRHGDDRGDDVYRHDRRLNDHGREKAAKAAKRLIEKYGHPDIVYVSPFRRTLETLDVMTARFVRPVVVRCDPRIAQHLSEKQRRDPKISPETQAQITIDEDRATFQARIEDHVRTVRDLTGLIWCITHQSIIERVAEHFDVKMPKDLDFLDHVVMLR